VSGFVVLKKEGAPSCYSQLALFRKEQLRKDFFSNCSEKNAYVVAKPPRGAPSFHKLALRALPQIQYDKLPPA